MFVALMRTLYRDASNLWRQTRPCSYLHFPSISRPQA